MNRVIVGLTNDEVLYTWRLREVGGYWLDDGLEGTLDELAEYIGGRPCEVWLLLPGARVITHQMAFSPQERKHLASITPFQLEDSVATDVDLLHFALAATGETEVDVAYT
ncbi:MAG: type II secretion system protein GspL, partial [Exilibacterium sp.]